MKRINTTAVSAVVMLLIAAAIWIAIPGCIGETSSSVDIGPRAFPQFICGVMVILCMLQLALLALGIQKGTYKTIDFKGQIRVYAAMAIAVLGVIGALAVNVVVAGVCCSILFLAVLGIKNWKYYGAVAASGMLLLFLMKYVMHIRF